jgi:amidase
MRADDWATATVAELADALGTGELTSRALVEAYLARIERLDATFASIRCLSPTALSDAEESDARRREHGPRGPLEGIPVLVKDNIDVAGLPTTAGALALEHSTPLADAPLIARLRETGSVIVGKTNLSELANFLTDNMPGGYSSLGGQVLNPYDTSVTPSGSSSGSATALALGLAPIAIGTETDGSITCPSEAQSLVGFKPTRGLVSQRGIVPISPIQDCAGPMARTVADAALLLGAIAGEDDNAPGDAARAAASLRDLTLEAEALRGVHLGVAARQEDGSDADRAVHEAALDALRSAGAILREVTLPDLAQDDEMAALDFEFAPAFDGYLATLGPTAPMRSLAELHDWNLAHANTALKFGQTHVERALAIDHEAGRSTYEATRARDRAAVLGALTAALGDDLEALVFHRAAGCTLAARVGWPSVVLPAGYSEPARRPVGVMLVSRPWTDARLLSLAYSFERSLPARRPPWEINPAVFRHLG